MSEMLSPNTKAILLLTAPLIAGPDTGSADLLTPGEYKKLALRLRELGSQPADLLTPDIGRLLRDCPSAIGKGRLAPLLARGFLLSQAVERWQARAIWVVSRADAAYPRRLKARLREDAPAVLYGCGQREILNTGGLAVVGSRNADDELLEYAQGIGRLASRAKQTVVSGGARGIDQAAMRGALEAGGKVIGVLADGLEKAALNREHRNPILDGNLVLISPYDPSAGFNVGHAMQRNKVIYGLADAGLVVSSDVDKGGTWAGATEQLDKLRLVPVYVRSTGETGKGIEALRKKGALRWPNPQGADEFDAVFRGGPPHASPSLPQAQLSFPGQHPAPDSALDPAVELFEKVRTLLLRMLEKPRNPDRVASDLGVTKRQAEEWLRRLVEEGVVEKRRKPVSFVVRQVDLFNGRRSDGSEVQIGTAGSRE